MFPNLDHRSHDLELMDTQVYDSTTMSQTLRFLKFTNRFFGGVAVIRNFFDSVCSSWSPNQTIRILDVGTGLGDIPVALAQWGNRKGLTLQIDGIDVGPEIIQLAKHNTLPFPNIKIENCDIFKLPSSCPKYDYVMASLFLHHVPPQQSALVLKTLDKLSTRGLIISDLQRSACSYYAIGILSYMMGNKVVRHDGPLSVKRAFRREDLESLIKESDCAYLRIKKEPWFRFSLSGEKI